MDNKNIARFLLTFFLGFIGSIVINHTNLKPNGYTCRTGAYFWATLFTFGIYGLVACICNLTFDPTKEKNIGYKKNESAEKPIGEVLEATVVEEPEEPVVEVTVEEE